MHQSPVPVGSRWTHSFEEDTAGIQVYRPTTFAFPPSRRGRETLEFGPEGEVTEFTQGPDDRLRPTPAGAWRALGMNRYGRGGSPEAPAQVLEIIEATPEILKIRRA